MLHTTQLRTRWLFLIIPICLLAHPANAQSRPDQNVILQALQIISLGLQCPIQVSERSRVHTHTRNWLAAKATDFNFVTERTSAAPADRTISRQPLLVKTTYQYKGQWSNVFVSANNFDGEQTVRFRCNKRDDDCLIEINDSPLGAGEREENSASITVCDYDTAKNIKAAADILIELNGGTPSLTRPR